MINFVYGDQNNAVVRVGSIQPFSRTRINDCCVCFQNAELRKQLASLQHEFQELQLRSEAAIANEQAAREDSQTQAKAASEVRKRKVVMPFKAELQPVNNVGGIVLASWASGGHLNNQTLKNKVRLVLPTELEYVFLRMSVHFIASLS